MQMMKKLTLTAALLVMMTACVNENPKPRLSLFIGLDISGSFIKGGHFDDALDFMAHYIYGHLNGIGGLDVPRTLFVSSIGGAKANEPKTFYPIQTFQHKSVEEIREQLAEIFPKDKINKYTDYNAFFEQVAMTVKNKNLVLRPISIVMVSDGRPDTRNKGETDFSTISVKPLENLSRNVTLRLLYTNAVMGKSWQMDVKRNRVKVWTQDAEVMTSWKDPTILEPEKAFEERERFVAWLEDNVNFGVRARRVD